MKCMPCLFGAALSGLLALSVGCGKPAAPETSQPQTESRPKPVEATAPVVKEASQPAPPPAAPQVEVKAAVTNATNAAPAGAAKPDEIIATARKLVAEQKWQELAKKLGQLQGSDLTPAQQDSLRELKDQLEKMVKEALGK
jgi:hypothetical protein